MASLLLFFKLSDLLIYRVVSEFGEEHFFLLVDEFIDVLSALFFWELDSAPSDMHGFMNMILLLQVEVLFLRVVITG